MKLKEYILIKFIKSRFHIRSENAQNFYFAIQNTLRIVNTLMPIIISYVKGECKNQFLDTSE